MGKNLHSTIISFFERKIREHSKVSNCENIDNEDYYFYKVKRKDGFSELNIMIADEYDYKLSNFFQRPSIAKENTFIYVARPEAQYSKKIVDIAKQNKVSIGKFSALYGALNFEKHWEYIPKERQKKI